MPRIVALVVVIVSAVLAAGCGGAGYRVVRSDPRVEYPDGPMGFDGGAATATLAAAMRAGLSEAVRGHEIVDSTEGSGAPEFTIRVAALDQAEGRLTARVLIVDAQGAVTSELELATEATASDDDARRAATEIGERVAHYLETRSQHHY